MSLPTQGQLGKYSKKFNCAMLPFMFANKVDAIDMSGAGDTFDGAFVAAYLAGRPVDECLRFANAAVSVSLPAP